MTDWEQKQSQKFCIHFTCDSNPGCPAGSDRACNDFHPCSSWLLGNLLLNNLLLHSRVSKCVYYPMAVKAARAEMFRWNLEFVFTNTVSQSILQMHCSEVSHPQKVAESSQIFNSNQQEQLSAGNKVHKICRQVSVRGDTNWLLLRGKTWWLLGICGSPALGWQKTIQISWSAASCLLLAPAGFLLGNLVNPI